MTLPERFRFSQSVFQSYTQCPLQCRLRYIERQPWPAPEQEPVQEHEQHRINGELFHRLAQQALLGIPPDILQAQVNRLGPPLADWWQAFLETQSERLQPPEGWQVLPEYSLSARLRNGYRLYAKLDALVISPEGWTIYDWKTEARPPRRERLAARWQTRTYLALATLVSGLQPEKIRMVYWYAVNPRHPFTFPYDRQTFASDWEDINQLAEEIATAEYFPRTADERLCRWCAYRSYCNRGITAGDLSEAEFLPEDDVPETLDFDEIEPLPFL